MGVAMSDDKKICGKLSQWYINCGCNVGLAFARPLFKILLIGFHPVLNTAQIQARALRIRGIRHP
jgi:hypothetical protein